MIEGVRLKQHCRQPRSPCILHQPYFACRLHGRCEELLFGTSEHLECRDLRTQEELNLEALLLPKSVFNSHSRKLSLSCVDFDSMPVHDQKTAARLSTSVQLSYLESILTSHLCLVVLFTQLSTISIPWLVCAPWYRLHRRLTILSPKAHFQPRRTCCRRAPCLQSSLLAVDTGVGESDVHGFHCFTRYFH